MIADEADEVREAMRQVRSQFSDELQQFVERTRVLSDWRYYIRSAPWLSVGAAAAAGFLLISSRPKVVQADPAQIAKVMKHRPLVVSEPDAKGKRKSLGTTVIGIAAPVLMKAGAAFASQQIRQWFGTSRGSSRQTDFGSTTVGDNRSRSGDGKDPATN